jgi:predicted nucleic acid-binding protein
LTAPGHLFGWLRSRQHPRQAIEEVPRLGIEVLPIERHLPPLAVSLSQLHGLLTSDAFVVASLQDQGIVHLASNDTDFDRVPGIMRYGPV